MSLADVHLDPPSPPLFIGCGMLCLQPLHVIASGVKTAKAVVLTSEGGNFKSLRELTECMRASMLLPGITGPMVSGSSMSKLRK